MMTKHLSLTHIPYMTGARHGGNATAAVSRPTPPCPLCSLPVYWHVFYRVCGTCFPQAQQRRCDTSAAPCYGTPQNTTLEPLINVSLFSVASISFHPRLCSFASNHILFQVILICFFHSVFSVASISFHSRIYSLASIIFSSRRTAAGVCGPRPARCWASMPPTVVTMCWTRLRWISRPLWWRVQAGSGGWQRAACVDGL